MIMYFYTIDTQRNAKTKMVQIYKHKWSINMIKFLASYTPKKFDFCITFIIVILVHQSPPITRFVFWIIRLVFIDIQSWKYVNIHVIIINSWSFWVLYASNESNYKIIYGMLPQQLTVIKFFAIDIQRCHYPSCT